MRTIAHIVLMAAIPFGLLGCGDSGSSNPNAPSAQTLVGTWRATSAEYVSGANPNVRVEVISHGTTMILTLTSTNTFTLTITDPGQPTEVITGTWSSSRDVLTIRRTGVTGESQFDMSMSGDTLRLTGGHILYDVDGNDVDEEAILNMTLVRQ